MLNIPRNMVIVITISNRHISIDVSIIGSLMIDAICISISSNYTLLPMMHNGNMIMMAIASISMCIFIIIVVDSMRKTCSIINKVRIQIIGISTLINMLRTCQNSIRWSIVAMIICRSMCLSIIIITIIIMIIIIMQVQKTLLLSS